MYELFSLLRTGEIHWLDCQKAPYSKGVLDKLRSRGLVKLERDRTQGDWFYRPSDKAYQQFPFAARPKSGWRKS